MSKYKAGDKVVMEIISADQDEIKTYSVSGVNNNWRWCLPQGLLERYIEPLSTYTEPLEAKIRRQAAEITRLLRENKELKNEKQELTRERNQLMGRCGGLSAAKIKAFNNGRLAGQNEAWELAQKIFKSDIYGGFSSTEIGEIFGYDFLTDIITKHTYPEAAAKVEAWERQKEEIKVGDVYKSLSGNFVVCGIDREKDMAKALWDDLSVGKIYLYEIKEQYTKTGRHIDIDSFLKQIGGGDDEK